MRAYFAVFGATILAAVACGARTGLPVPDVSGPDAGVDAPTPLDAPDVFDAPATFDAPFDAPRELSCADAGIQFVYLITEESVLYSFYPPTGELHELGIINCPTGAGPTQVTPFSMGVNRAGVAFSVFNDGNLFVFDTSHPSDSCRRTPYLPTVLGSQVTFGMAFSANVSDPGESLFVAGSDPGNGAPVTVPELLGEIDLTTYKLQQVGQFPVVIGSAELTGTGDGRLFGFGVDQPGTSGPTTYRLLEFDKSTAGLISNLPLDMPAGNEFGISAWAFAYYGGDFYFFTSPGGGFTVISHYHPQPGDTRATATQIAMVTNTIVGAGVSTCAPMQ